MEGWLPPAPLAVWAALGGFWGVGQGRGNQVALWCLRAKALDSGLPEFQSCACYSLPL